MKQRPKLTSPRYYQLQVHHINHHHHQKWSDQPWQQEQGRTRNTLVGTQTAREAAPGLPPTKSPQSMEVWGMGDQVLLTAPPAATTVMVQHRSRILAPSTTTTKDFKVNCPLLSHLPRLINLWPKIRDQEVDTSRMWRGWWRVPCVRVFYRLSWNIFWPVHSWH